MYPPPGFLTCVKRGLLRRCPHCGRGRIFRSFLHLRRFCPECRWIVEREPGTVTGAMYLVSIVTMFFAVFVWLVSMLLAWSVGTTLAVSLPLIAAFSLAALPASKGLWIAVEHWTDYATGKAEEPDYPAKAFEPDSS